MKAESECEAGSLERRGRKANIKVDAVPAQQHAKNAKLSGLSALRKLSLEGRIWK